MTAATPRASCKLGGAHMNAAAAKDDGLTRVLARLWLAHMRLRIARLLVWIVKTLRL